MIKKVKILVLLLLVFWGYAFPQKEITHEVLVPAGGLTTLSTYSISYSIGETAIETIGGSGLVLTQGFQQPSIIRPEEYNDPIKGVYAYPNPAINYIDVKFIGDDAREFRIDLINVNGTIVKTATIKFLMAYFYIHRIGIDDLLRGLYFVRVTSIDGVYDRSFKIEKM